MWRRGTASQTTLRNARASPVIASFSASLATPRSSSRTSPFTALVTLSFLLFCPSISSEFSISSSFENTRDFWRERSSLSFASSFSSDFLVASATCKGTAGGSVYLPRCYKKTAREGWRRVQMSQKNNEGRGGASTRRFSSSRQKLQIHTNPCKECYDKPRQEDNYTL